MLLATMRLAAVEGALAKDAKVVVAVLVSSPPSLKDVAFIRRLQRPSR